ncbi:hypothetical protein [Leucobacter ruminantium]|uniref:DUF2207 domain-containing protein n=1 Tax=Leucobacter ruminantium TaxID=1289170 RepID=A0A939RZ14_9MICO|nr:hypothetical protein [Leucobacter ruminantium]MBO1805029.1 hypothetical protein [Leucobacter ruminantium]
MSRRRRRSEPDSLPAPDPFDLAGSDPELLNSGRIPDPQPEHAPLFRWLAGVLTAVEARLRARGNRSIRFAIGFCWVLVMAIGVLLLLGPVINEPRDFDDVLDSAKVGEVDWIATDANIDYSITRTEGGRFSAKISERYTADFANGPERSIERKFVTEFDGHDTGFEMHSATIDGESADVEVKRGATITTVTLAPPDGAKLEGKRAIALDYSMRDLASPRVDEATGGAVDGWSWPLLGPSWPQATKGVDVSLTLSRELDEALVRAPRAYVGWLLLSGTEWLTPEKETAEGVRYAFSNDDTLPPYPDLVIDTAFEAGTFGQPPTTALFWWQTWGPLLPLAFLAVLLPFALAARRVVWADSAGEPWYLARAELPELSPSEAAQLLDRPWHAELVAELARGDAASGSPGRSDRRRNAKASAARGKATAVARSGRLGSAARPGREARLAAIARAGMRAGRIGNLPSVLRQRSRWSRNDRPVEGGLRWVPDSYVRDTFILAPIAVVLLQWGLLRQLSHQVILTVVWWPGLFVLVSSALAVMIVWAVWRPRPLTRDGALVVQQLKGIDVYARATRLLDRGTVEEPLLPYAVLFESSRRAGRRVAASAGREAGDRWLGRGWRTEHFVSLPAALALLASVGLLAGSIVTVSARPAPYAEADFVTWPSGPSGTVWSQVEGFTIDGELQRDERGGARLRVVEHDSVRFTPGGSSVPQFAREWPRERFGQSLGLEIESVSVDGEEVPFQEVAGPQSTAMVTRMSDVLDGLYDVEVVYALTSPVVDSANGAEPQQLRWTAWHGFWEDAHYTDTENPFDGRAPVRPLSVTLAIDPRIADEIESGGWIDYDGDRERVPYEDGNWYRPWQYDTTAYPEMLFDERTPYELRIGSERRLDDGSLVVSLDADAVQSRRADDHDPETPESAWEVSEEINGTLEKYDLGTSGDLGVVLNFAPGTFESVDPGAYERYRLAYRAPYAAVLGLAGIIVVASLGVLAFAARSRRGPSASLRTVAYGAIPIAAIAQSVLFFWAVMSMPGGNGEGWAAIAVGAIMLAAVAAQAVLVARMGPAGKGQNKSHD